MIRTLLMAAAMTAAALATTPAYAGKKSPKPPVTTTKELEAQDRLENFQIQSLSKSENVRSQAEKRLEQQRKDLIRNWGG